MPTFPGLTPRDLATLANLAGSLLLPLAVIAFAGRITLRRAAAHAVAPRPGHDRVAALWFGYAQLLKLAIAAMAVFWFPALFIAANSPVSHRVFASVPRPLHGGVVWLCSFLPYIFAAMTLVAWQHDIARRLGVSDRPRDDVRRELRWSWALLALPSLLFAHSVVAASSRRWDAVAVLALAAVGSYAVLAARWRGVVGFTPHAADQGPLREAVFALGERAGVRIRQLYVVPMKASGLANAYAVQGDVVVLTDLLLERLSKREVTAVLAHEVGHLAAKHPVRIARVGAVAFVPGFALVYLPHMLAAGVALLVAGALASQAHRRRIEFDADRRAVALGDDAEGLIAGLVKLAGIARVPLRWGRFFGWLLTHPSTEARATALVRHGVLRPERAHALLEGARLDDEHFAVPDVVGSQTRVFTTPFKHALSQRSAWAQLLMAVLLATTVALLTNAVGTGAAVRAWGFAAAVLVTFSGLLVVAGRLSMAGFARLRGALETRHGCTRARTLAFVGWSPEGAPRVYEGFHNWDIGLLEADGARLLHHGDGVRFALAAGEVVSLGWAEAPPGWFGAPAIRLEWARDDGTQGVLRLSSLESATWFGIAAANRRLWLALERWRAASAGTSAAAAGSVWPPPAAWKVTSQRPNEAVALRSFVVVLITSAIFACVASLCARLPFDPTRAAGFADVWGSMVVARWLMLAPVASWRERPVRAAVTRLGREP